MRQDRAFNLTSAGGQPVDATLTALAAANWAANAVPIGTGADTFAQTAFAANTFPARASTGNLVAKAITDFGLSLVDDATAGDALTTLGVSAYVQTILNDADAPTARATLLAVGYWASTSDPTVNDDTTNGTRVGDKWVNTNTNNVFDCLAVTDGAAIWQHRPRVLGASAAAASHTGDTSETIKATVVIPANAMGANGILRLSSTFSYPSTANNKNMRWRLGGIGGTVCMNFTATTSVNYSDQRRLANRNATNSQIVSSSSGGTAGGLGTGANALVAPASDTTAALDLVLTVQLADSGETIIMESYMVELLRPNIGP